MGTADNRARADTGRLRSALAVPAVERNRDKCRSQLLQAVGGYRCDIYGNHVSLRLHPLFPITNASPVCAVRRASVHYLPGEGERDECAFVIAPYSKHGTWLFNDERRNLVEEPLVAAAPETIAEIGGGYSERQGGIPTHLSAGAFSICFDEQPQSRFGSPKYPQAHPSLGTIELFCDACIPRQGRLRATLRQRRQLGKP